MRTPPSQRWAAAQNALMALLANVRPRFIPFFLSETTKAVLYADAFFKEGERRQKAGFVDVATRARIEDRWNNGWGFVLRIGEKVFFANGTIPANFLKHFAARRAFIYVLQIVAQLIALSTFARHLPELWVAWIDQEKRRFAKAMGRMWPSTACWPPSGRWHPRYSGRPSSTE